ncbi:hypothetical protein HYH03_012912 [Edaphochlamys debaryana]|uniref:Uncharacterized protein n=1 Tax=Edaphochlamys debaryana TaxID=47281 RepID=A0A836BV19_9CHLO|nr:hypothetical protein HYH03_012912 [Edaphochlamys debaryana]|eukprot:KAG2488593.1 hypothetical protein HYH03_012912 [Edaphochlamys debaryana]
MPSSDSEADSEAYSLLGAPRRSTAAALRCGMAKGRLPELVLEGKAELSQALCLCLETLGLGTSGPDRQAAAASSLVALATHPKLRPAVDHLLLLRRLARVVELTDCPWALRKAASALMAIAEDSGWGQGKVGSGCVAELVKAAALRCIDALSTAAARCRAQLLGGHIKEASGPAASPGPSDGAAATSTAPPLPADVSLLQSPAVLGLLSREEVAAAVAALAGCVGAAGAAPSLLAALAAALEHEAATSPGTGAAACAAMQQEGAVGALAKALGEASDNAVSALRCLRRMQLSPAAAATLHRQAATAALQAGALPALAKRLGASPPEEAVTALELMLLLAEAGGSEADANGGGPATLVRSALLPAPGGISAFLEASHRPLRLVQRSCCWRAMMLVPREQLSVTADRLCLLAEAAANRLAAGEQRRLASMLLVAGKAWLSAEGPVTPHCGAWSTASALLRLAVALLQAEPHAAAAATARRSTQMILNAMNAFLPPARALAGNEPAAAAAADAAASPAPGAEALTDLGLCLNAVTAFLRPARAGGGRPAPHSGLAPAAGRERLTRLAVSALAAEGQGGGLASGGTAGAGAPAAALEALRVVAGAAAVLGECCPCGTP